MDTRLMNRGVEDLLLAMLSEAPVVHVAGPRQSGKSTLVRDLIADRFPARYITLDDALVLDAVRSDPQGFVSSLSDSPAIIDEVQLAPELFRAIKLSVDRDRSSGRFLLTGSADPAFSPQLGESLAGRMRGLVLWPLEQGELAGRAGTFLSRAFAAGAGFEATSSDVSRAELLARIVTGGFPEVHTLPSAEARARWMTDYVQRIVERDVPRLAEIADRLAVPRLLRLLAARSMQLLNLSEVGRLAEVKRATLDRYVALLEAAYLVRLVPAWSGDIARELSKRPKPLLTDTGLACHVLGADEVRLADDPGLLGPLLEGFVACELLRQSAFAGRQVRLCHFRTQSAEVDLVLEDAAGRLVGIEVKASATPTSADFSGLRSFADAVGTRFVRGIVLHTGASAAPFGDGLWAAPIAELWR